MSIRSLDEMDRKIVRTLQANPDMSIADISAEVGLSPTPCWRRVKRLEEELVIVRRAVIFDPRKLGLTINVLANVKLHRHDEDTLEALEREARDYPEILECYSMSGESDYVMRVVTTDIEAYERFLKKVLLHLPGVASVNSSFTLKTIKATTNLPV